MGHPKFSIEPQMYLEGIPQFVPDEKYVAAFGLQWIEHQFTQLDSYTGLSITRDRFIRMLGPIHAQLVNKTVLEAGCGAGRFTELLLENKIHLTAIDLSAAVLANKKNNGENSSLRLVRGSITELPFHDEEFDIVFCPGVVQHTPNPKKSILELYRNTKPGGWLVFDQYRFNLSTFLRTSWVLRILLKRLSPKLGLKATDALVKFWLPVHRKVSGKRFLEVILFRFSPITAHYTSYPTMSEQNQVEWARLNTHDNLCDFHKHPTTYRRLEKSLGNMGAINLYLNIMPYTIEVRCQKPYMDPKKNVVSKNIVIRSRGSKIQSG